MTGDVLARLRAVSKQFGDVLALDGIDIDIHHGVSTALVGGNGAGKTTLLRILAGVYRPSHGTALLGAGDIVDHRRRIGVMTESTGLHVRLTAWENIRFHARLFGVEDSVARRRAEAHAAPLGMLGALDRRTEGFSRGMRQKTALLRALVHEPDLLLLDEPTAGLDITSARAVRSLIEELVAVGRGVIWSTHDLGAASVCDRLVIVHNAKIVADGPLSTLLNEAGVGGIEALHQMHTAEATREFLEGAEVGA